ncbi:MAG: RidA family protein [Planctomycetota bacterium JB042]
MSIEPIQPPTFPAPKGYSNGVLVRGPHDLLVVAGQIGWDAEERIVSDDFVAQFDRALANVLAVVRAAGGGPEHVVRLTMYATDKREYLDRLREVGAAYRERMGRHYPAMAMVEVKALVEDGAKIEIEATAALPRAAANEET